MAVQPLVRLRADEAVYEDAGTNPCEDTDPVVRWAYAAASSIAGFSHQVAVGRQPIYNVNDGGFPSLSFTKDVLLIDHTADWAGWSGMSWLMAVHYTTSVSPEFSWSFGAAAWDAVNLRSGSLGGGVGLDLLWNGGGFSTDRYASLMPTFGRWNILAGTVSATEIRLWLNRQAIARRTITGSLTLGTAAKAIGSSEDNTTYGITSLKLREMTFWNSMLTEAQMNAEVDDAMTRWSVTNEIAPAASGGLLLHPGMAGGMRG